MALISLLMIGGTAGRQLVPGRMQSMAEISYEFVANTIRSTAGTEGMKFFPLVFSLFMFIPVSNMIGIIPYTFTISSHLIVTAALALLVFFTVLIYGFYKNGLKFFKLFVPSGIPIFILPLVVFIEVFSFFLRPISHSRASVRQHAGGPHRAESVRELRHHARRPSASSAGSAPCCRSALTDRADRARAAGRVPAGLRLHHPHLHLHQRCYPSGPLIRPHLNKPQEGVRFMDPIAAKYIGAGIACIGMGGAGAGVGIIFGNYLAAAVRNPSAAQGQFGNLIFGFAVTEALGIFSLLIALLLLFAL